MRHAKHTTLNRRLARYPTTPERPCLTHGIGIRNGYHSIALHPADRHFTTFITPWGRYRYMTAPQGYITSGDGYTRRYDEIVSLIERKTKCIDDTLLWSSSIQESFHQVQEWLDICGRHPESDSPRRQWSSRASR